MSRALAYLLLLCWLSCFVGCAQAPQGASGVNPDWVPAGFTAIPSHGFHAVYVGPDAVLPDYTIISIEPLQFDGLQVEAAPVATTLARDWQMTPERQENLRASWASAVQYFFRDYDVAGGSGSIAVTARLLRVAPGRPTVATIGATVGPRSASRDVVELLAEFRLRDNDSGEVMLVARDSRTMTAAALSRTGSVSINALFRSWAGGLQSLASDA